jgi:peptidoglycan/xylan/chitin deacetylase (PgdA/CDA1 family)
LTIVVHGSPERQQFALTFDDGPERGVTDRLLDLLDERDVMATFFCVGEQIEADPDLAREILARGHEIGSHTQSHLNHHDQEPDALPDFLDGVATISRLLDARPRFYRPPYGHFTHKVLAEAEQLHVIPVFWSAWGLDWFPDDAQTIAARVLEDLTPGCIVLLHDSSRYTDKRNDCTPTIEAVDLIVEEADRRGLQPAALGQLLS